MQIGISGRFYEFHPDGRGSFLIYSGNNYVSKLTPRVGFTGEYLVWSSEPSLDTYLLDLLSLQIELFYQSDNSANR